MIKESRRKGRVRGVKMARKMQVCRNCRRFTKENVCPTCKSTNLSASWKGIVVILNADSEVAKMLKVNEADKYALYVG
jgi:RNA polymerase subunit RPABC4/transcription elongation factor Spt4